MKLLNSTLHDKSLNSYESALLFRGLAYSGVLGTEIPEIIPCYGFNQHNPNHAYDVFEHTISAITNIDKSYEFLQTFGIHVNYTEYAFIAKIVLLLHDIAKPACFVMRDKKGTFYGHAEESSKMAISILKRLKLEKGVCDSKIVYLIENHMCLRELFRAKDKTIIKHLRNLGLDNLPYVLGITYCDILGKGLPEKAQADLEELQYFTKRALNIVQYAIA